ncbi:hypothetical protein [Anabaena subtropica]|uniref:Uncharacterized protein n=1 Tax=Anabaena subtropica FACHB-260 TaxID=2692884 RepID=A0ABR8CSI8_9NOST|nr:hypothetical protein [Anabaena subtropica]MBD2345934.1 hypothetical protein [Anabaena subtropica FACHB-260]
MFNNISAKADKYIVFILIFILSNILAYPAFSSVCRNYNGQNICILNINRSAKNYWEYRASITVDGQKKPLEVYNCRQRFKVQPNGTVVPFEHQDPGDLICRFFKNTSYERN